LQNCCRITGCRAPPLSDLAFGFVKGAPGVSDVTFKENACRTRAGHAAENLNTVRKITMNLLRQETSMKRSIPKKRLYAAFPDKYLQRFLAYARWSFDAFSLIGGCQDG
jgi:hypothetical protein